MPRSDSKDLGQYLAVSLHDFAFLVIAQPCLILSATFGHLWRKAAFSPGTDAFATAPAPATWDDWTGNVGCVLGLCPPAGGHWKGGPYRVGLNSDWSTHKLTCNMDCNLVLLRDIGTWSQGLDWKGGPQWRSSEEWSPGPAFVTCPLCHFGLVLLSPWASGASAKWEHWVPGFPKGIVAILKYHLWLRSAGSCEVFEARSFAYLLLESMCPWMSIRRPLITGAFWICLSL